MEEEHCTASEYIVHAALAVAIPIIGTLLFIAASRTHERNMKEALIEASVVGLFHGIVMSVLLCTGVISSILQQESSCQR